MTSSGWGRNVLKGMRKRSAKASHFASAILQVATEVAVLGGVPIRF